jgi:hypothetical protein
MNSCKDVNSSLANHFRLSHEKCLKTDMLEERDTKCVLLIRS